MSTSQSQPGKKILSPDVNRILYVRNLPFKITNKQLYDIFGKYGAVRQIRIGNTKDTRGTAYVVYEELQDAANACEHLTGYAVSGRYLVLMYFQPVKYARKVEQQALTTLMHNAK